MLTLDHIGIAVRDLDAAAAIYRLMGLMPTHREVVADQGVETMMIPIGGTRIELLRPLSDDSPVGRFIAKRGEGVHHIAFGVDDIRAELTRLTASKVQLIDREPRLGAGGCLMAFVHPKSVGGVLIELVEKQSGN